MRPEFGAAAVNTRALEGLSRGYESGDTQIGNGDASSIVTGTKPGAKDLSFAQFTASRGYWESE